MGYQPYLIAGFQTAKNISMEPWLSPMDAFPTLENMFVNKGVLEKRGGFSSLGTMKHGASAQTTSVITGIHCYEKDGMPGLLVMDSKGSAGAYTGRCNFYNPIDGTMTDISSDLTTPADIFSGSPSDFFHFRNWLGVGYMTNNVDQIHKWAGRGNAVVPHNIQVSSDTKTNHIDTCRFIFIIDDRMVLVDTVEFGDWYPNRLRYGAVLQTDFTESGGGTDDAETQERICAAGMIGKTAYAFFQGVEGGSLWRIRRTGNTDTPLEWERITKTEGSRSPYSGVEFKDGLAAVGMSNILYYDGFKVKTLDMPNVRDILSEFNDAYIRSVFGYRQREKEHNHLLFTFADTSSSVVNRILDYNITEENWTVHKSNQTFFLNCIGGFNGQKVPTMAELDDVVTADEALVSAITVDSRAILGTPKPYTIIGCRNSKIYKWNNGEYDGTNDANGVIEIKAESSRMNPFVKEGRKAALEKIMFLVDHSTTASFLASVYKDSRTATAYKTKTISCTSPDTGVDKFWVTLFCDGEVGNFHRLKISHSAKGNTPKIHAIMPYFEAAGRLDA